MWLESFKLCPLEVLCSTFEKALASPSAAVPPEVICAFRILWPRKKLQVRWLKRIRRWASSSLCVLMAWTLSWARRSSRTSTCREWRRGRRRPFGLRYSSWGLDGGEWPEQRLLNPDLFPGRMVFWLVSTLPVHPVGSLWWSPWWAPSTPTSTCRWGWLAPSRKACHAG